MKLPGFALNSALRISLLYVAFAGGWVVLSDRLLQWLLPDMHSLTMLQSIKGMGFVVVTAAILYSLIKSSSRERVSRLESSLQHLSQYANDIVLLIDEAGHFIEVNDRALQQYGYTLEEILHKTIYDLYPANAMHDPAQGHEWPEWSGGMFETRHCRKNGSDFPVEVGARLLQENGRTYCHMVVRDISARKTADARIQRLTNLYAALSETNQAIMRMDQEAELFPLVCRVAVEDGGMNMAWVGQLEEGSGLIVPAASHGSGTNYLQGIVISSHGDVPEGCGPIGTAWRENRPIIVNDFPLSPVTAPWQARAAGYGWGSIAAIPIPRGGHPHAVLGVYHCELNAFDAEAIALLTEMASDISFALDHLETERKRAILQADLAIAQQRLAHLTEVSPAAIYRLTPQQYENGGFVVDFISGNAQQVTGYAPETWLATPGFWFAHLHPDDRPAAQQAQQQLLEQGAAQLQYRFLHSDDSYHWISDQLILYRDGDGNPTEIAGAWLDITARRLAEERLRLNARVFENSREGIVITDSDIRILSINPAFTKITGYAEADALGKKPSMLSSGHHDTDFYRDMWEAINKTGQWLGEIWNRRKDGEVYPEWLHITTLRDDSGAVTHYIGMFTDVSLHKKMEERINQLTRYDEVTGLPNMFFFDDLLSMAINEASQGHHGIAVVRLDIENFHSIDDNFGFEVGDKTLKVIADRLVQAAGNESLVTRLAKDNFTIAYPRIRDTMQATLLADKLQQAVAQVINIGQFEIHPGAKLGISFYPADGVSAPDLVQKAGIALNRAKLDKGSGLRFFTQDMNDMLLAKIALTNDMRHAIERDEFELYYQPQVEIASGRIVGMEALVRWNHPLNGLLLPNEFVALAEESGLIQPLGNWVLRRALLQMREWRNSGYGGDLVVSVNASALQLETTELIELLEKLLQETGLPSNCIELEMTESSLMSNIGQTQQILKKFKALGIQLSIDDFGTGYSSLAYLKQFSVDKLKIDKSFIDNLTSNANNAVIVQATIAMSHSLGLQVIAEGVETQEQASYLRTMLCDQFQGYLFSRPVPAKDIPPLLRTKPGEQSLPAANAQRTLLLVDDEPNVLASLKRILRHDGYHILTAGGGTEAFDLLARHPVGVIVSDQRMPGMTGTELLSQAKMMYPQTLRIILSGYTEVNTITEAINRGEVYKFLTKPWEDEPMRDAIREAFVRYEQNCSNSKGELS